MFHTLALSNIMETLCVSQGQDVSQVLSRLTRLQVYHVGATDELMLFSKDVNCLLFFIDDVIL